MLKKTLLCMVLSVSKLCLFFCLQSSFKIETNLNANLHVEKRGSRPGLTGDFVTFIKINSSSKHVHFQTKMFGSDRDILDSATQPCLLPVISLSPHRKLLIQLTRRGRKLNNWTSVIPYSLGVSFNRHLHDGVILLTRTECCQSPLL